MPYTVKSKTTGEVKVVDDAKRAHLISELGYSDSDFRQQPVTAPLASTAASRPARESTYVNLDAVSGAGKYVPKSTTAEPSPMREAVNQTLRDYFPSTARAVEEQGSKFPLWAGVRDVATLPLRAGAGAATALADVAAGQPGNIETFFETTRSPTKSIEGYRPRNRVGQIAQEAAAASTEDPTTLPTLSIAPTRGLLGMLKVGALTGAGTYGTHVLDRSQLEGQDIADALRNETRTQMIQDVLPLALPIAMTGVGKAIKSDFNPLMWAVRNLGEKGKEHAYDLVTRIVKPPPALKQGAVHEGFTEGIRKSVGDRPILPEIVKYGEGAADIPANYFKLKAETTKGIEPAMQALEEAGVRVDRNKVFEAAREAMVAEQSKGTARAFPHGQQQKALNELFERLYVHEDPILQRWASSLRAGLKGEPGFVPPKPLAYEVTNFNRAPKITTRELTAAEKAVMTPEEIAAFTAEAGADRVKALESLVSTRRVTPQQYADLVEVGAVSPAKHEWLPFDLKQKMPARSGKSIPGSYTQPLYEFPTGELKPLGHAFEYAPMSPRYGQNLKSSLYNEAFRKPQEPDLAIEEVARHAAAEIRRQLTEPSEMTLESVLGAARARKAAPQYKYESKLPQETFDPSQVERAFAAPGEGMTANEARALYKSEMEKVAPIYAMEDAMERAKHTLANRHEESLLTPSIWKAALGGPGEMRKFLHVRPGYARGVYDYGEATKKLADILGENPRLDSWLPLDMLRMGALKLGRTAAPGVAPLARTGAVVVSKRDDTKTKKEK